MLSYNKCNIMQELGYTATPARLKSSDTSATSSIDDDDEETAAKASLDTILDANSRPAIAIRPEAMDWSDNLCGIDPLLSSSPRKKSTKLDHGNLSSEGSHSKSANVLTYTNAMTCKDQPTEGSVQAATASLSPANPATSRKTTASASFSNSHPREGRDDPRDR